MVIRKLFPLALVFAIAALAASLLLPSPASADLSHARIIRLSFVQGDVRVLRDVHGDALTDGKNLWEAAALNLPIRQGYVLATDHGRATVEFENGALAFLNENTVIEFYELSLDNGMRSTKLVVRQGTASFFVTSSSGDYFSVTGGDFTAEATGRANFRLDNFDDGSSVNVLAGHVAVLHKDKTTELGKGQSLSMTATDANVQNIGNAPQADDFDRWVSKRVESSVAATSAGLQYANGSSYVSGFGDLYTYGSWIPINGYGYGWQPFGAGLGWSPFAYGGWFQDSAFGLGFFGNQPWGWLPYHYGGWLFQPGIGWLWTPGNLGRSGFTAWRPSTVTWVHAKSGVVGAVPTHPLDVAGKTPTNLQQGVFPVAKGAVSNTTVASSNEQWKVEKNPGRAEVSSALRPSARPSLVSRSLTQTGGGRLGGNSSGMAFDAASHRFVNARSGSSVAMSDRVQRSETGKPAAASAANSTMARRSETAPARRPMAPAASASQRSSSGAFPSVGGGGSSGRTTTTTTTTRSSAGTASSGGRPH
jgi:FecR protein